MSNSREITFDYNGEAGVLFHKIVSIKSSDSGESSTVYWAERKNKNKWVRQVDQLPCDLFPYNYPDVAKSDSILLLSDEEEVEYVKELSTISRKITPTCIPDDIWKDDYALKLRNKHVVIMLRKNSTPYFYATRLYSAAKSVRVVELNYRKADSAAERNPGVRKYIQSSMHSAEDIMNLIDGTLPIEKDSKGLVLDESYIGIEQVLEHPDRFGRETVLERISQIHSPSLKADILKKISKEIGLTPEEAKAEMDAVKEKAQSEDKIKKQEEASELRLKGLVDVGINDKGSRVFLFLDADGVLKSFPYLDGKNEHGEQVRFIPPEKMNFLIPQSKDVIEHYGKEDTNLFQELMDLSRKYVHLKEIDRVIMICTVFLSYVIHHPDIHYLPIIFMVSPPNHGKSHVLKFIANTGFRGKWFRSFNLSACQRYNDEFHSVTCLDLYDFGKAIKSQDHIDFVLGKIEKGATIPKVNRPSAERYQQSDEYEPYGLLVVGSNSEIPANYEALLTRILPLQNILSDSRPDIEKPDNPADFLGFRNRLTAWKARMMNRRFTDRGYIELGGRLYDMGQPFLQILNTVYPQGYEQMVEYLKALEHRKAMDKSQSSEAIILSVIKFLHNQEALKSIRETGSRPQMVWLSQRSLIDMVLPMIPKITNRAVTAICKEKFNLHEKHKRNNDYLIRVEDAHLNNLLKTFGVDEDEQQITVPDTADELINTYAVEQKDR